MRKLKKYPPTMIYEEKELKIILGGYGVFKGDSFITSVASIQNLLSQQREELSEGKLEKLAELEHEQWMKWSKHVANDMNEHDASLMYWGELTYKWSRNWKPYHQLSEEEKEKDRVWARKVLDTLAPKEEGKGGA